MTIDCTTLTPNQPDGLPTYTVPLTSDQLTAIQTALAALITPPTGKTVNANLAVCNISIDCNGVAQALIVFR